MRQKGFRQNFTQSFATLPLVALVTAAVWMLPNLSSLRLGGGLLATALMTYVVIECNNRYHLLRVRSRMNSVVFLVLMAAFPTLHDLGLHLIPAAALLSAYFVLFRTYGQTRTQGTLFHTTLLLSLGSLAFPQLIIVHSISALSAVRCSVLCSPIGFILRFNSPFATSIGRLFRHNFGNNSLLCRLLPIPMFPSPIGWATPQ